MTTNEARTCECCGRDATDDHYTLMGNAGNEDMRWALVCGSCTRSTSGDEDLYRRVRAWRTAKAAQLEALEFVAPRDLTIQRTPSPTQQYHDKPIRIFARDRIRFAPEGTTTMWRMDGVSLCPLVQAADLPRIHAELCQLRDTPAPQGDSGFKVGDRVRIKRGESTATILAIDYVNVADLLYNDGEKMCCPLENLEPLPPSEDPKRQPEANPLRHLAEAFRSLDEPFLCGTCGSVAPAWRFADTYDCVYCRQNDVVQTGDGDMGRICEWPKGYGIDRIASATPKEAERAPWDWDCWSTPGAES